MGVDLTQFGNHHIKWRNRNFSDLTEEIKIKLDNITFHNADFLRLAALQWNNDFPKRVRTIREILTKQEWTYQQENEYYTFKKNKFIDFYGPFDLELSFHEHCIIFYNPPYRYEHWYKLDKTHRDEWRKYMSVVLKTFGGNKVIYLPDCMHPLDVFWNMFISNKSFKTIEKCLTLSQINK